MTNGVRQQVLRVAVPVPLFRCFDYFAPPDGPSAKPGMRLLVRFGRRRLVGIIVATDVSSTLDLKRLRAADRLLDEAPVFDTALLELLAWCARYYHHPLGEVFATALPLALRNTRPAAATPSHRGWRAVAEAPPAGEAGLARAPRQRELLAHIRAHDQAIAHASLRAEYPNAAAPLRALERRGLIEAVALAGGLEQGQAGAPPPLTAAQRDAASQIKALPRGFAPVLLEGVTGSGKTEIYFQRINVALAAGRQVLFLAPEIGLTPQLLERIRARFDTKLGVLHSQRSAGERADVWRAAAAGEADIVIGTRSAVFTPMPRLGLIVIDEEHDGSYKQQDGFRYHARDVALRRAQRAALPILLGSATPSLESLHNAQTQRYTPIQLTRRATGATRPPIRLIDIRSRPLDGGLSEPLLARIAPHLDAGNQVMLFINRRGFAPALACHDCGWIAPCQRCDAPMTLHAGVSKVLCHHCGAHARAPDACPVCGADSLIALGAGTERVAGALRSRFPDIAIARFDRDSMARKGRLEAQLAAVASGATRLLVGTQMLAKGHDFARLTCVGVLDVDRGLFSADFRAAERMAQLVTQVAGRAGRGDLAGEVWLQTRHPDHPLLAQLLAGGYPGFAKAMLAERAAARLPPHGYLALLRAEAPGPQAPQNFLTEASARLPHLANLDCWGPVPAPMPRRAGRYRAQLLLHADQRRHLHPALDHWQNILPELASARRVRWSIDVDPQDLA